MITTTKRRALPMLAAARWCGPASASPAQRCQQPNAAAVTSRRFQAQGPSAGPDDSQGLEDEYAKLKVNWFPGHMVKATKIIREKLKQVDMVFEVRDARIPFTSANDDLDRIVGPSKARLIVLNKADLANHSLEQRILQRFREEGKTAVFACGRTGTNVNKLLVWAREQGAKRGEFSTTGAVAMVVGMPNVGKSSLINVLRGKAERAQGRGGGGGGEHAKQVARVGAMPGVTRQVSAFRIASNPPLFLVDTPGVMVPRVEEVTQGLYLALTRAVPDASVPPDILVGFMLRGVRSRMLFGSRKTSLASRSLPPPPPPPPPTGSSAVTAADGSTGIVARQGRPKAVEAWLVKAGVISTRPPLPSAVDDALEEIKREGRSGRQREEDDMEELLEAVERESGAEGKPEPEMRRICCRFVLDAFRDGHFGRITLDSVPRVRRKDTEMPDARAGGGAETGWARGLVSGGRDREGHGRVRRANSGGQQRKEGSREAEPGRELAEVLSRDWSNPSSWEPAGRK